MKKHLLFLTLAAVLSLLPFGAKAQNVLDFGFEDGTIPATWTNDASHPWTVTNTSPGSGHSGTYCISSGNSGIASSSSEISATFTFTTAGSISFLGGIYGEGSTTFYDKCKVEMTAAQTEAESKFALLGADEKPEELDELKKAADEINKMWSKKRDELHDGKLQEIEEAHNLWLAGKKEEKDKQQETEAAHNIDAARSFKLNQDE